MLHSMVEDQAAGLRRMLGKQKTKNFVVLSAIAASQKNSFLLNLASSLIYAGNSTHILDMRTDQSGVSARVQSLIKSSLWDIAKKSQPLQACFYEFIQGGRISQLSKLAISEIVSQTSTIDHLSKIIQSLSMDSNIWLLDADLKQDNPYLITDFVESETILIVSSSPSSIKNGYSQLKHIANNYGRRKIGLLVINADDAQAQLIYKNIATASKDYLSVQLDFVGFIPEDDYLSKSALLGKSIIDAFPLSKASHAFRTIAESLMNKKSPSFVPKISLNSQPLVLEH